MGRGIDRLGFLLVVSELSTVIPNSDIGRKTRNTEVRDSKGEAPDD